MHVTPAESSSNYSSATAEATPQTGPRFQLDVLQPGEKSSNWRWLPRAGTGNRTQTTAQYFDNSPISPNYQPYKSWAFTLRNHHTPPLAPPHCYFVLVYNPNIFQLDGALKTLIYVCRDTAVWLESLLLITSENVNSLQIWRHSVTCYRQTLTNKTCSVSFRNLWHQNRSLSGSLALQHQGIRSHVQMAKWECTHSKTWRRVVHKSLPA